jgi:acyl carrier protein
VSAPERSPQRARVVDAVAAVLGVPVGTVSAAESLFDLPGFDSIAVVAVLERLESELGVEVPAERIVPDAFASISTLTELISQDAAVAPGGPR